MGKNMISTNKIKLKKSLKIALFTLLMLMIILGANFFIIKKLDKDVLELDREYTQKSKVNSTILIPTKFIRGERFYIRVPLKNGDTLNAFGDTGGGLSMILPSTLKSKKLESISKTGILKGIMPMNYILFKDLTDNHSFPAPTPLQSVVIRHPFSRVNEPYLIIPPNDEEISFMEKSMPEMEAFLGQDYFMNSSWTIDYPNKQILVNTPLSESTVNQTNVQRIGLKKNSKNKSIYGHASMKIEVDGESIDVLFDTGATIVLSENGKKELNIDLKTIGASFIATSIFKKWREKHPNWKYYPKADMSKDIIEVPKIKISDIEVGPVLFSQRPDENWSKGMIHSMDKVVKGAIGGSALKYLKVTIDYNSELIKFEKE